MMTTGNHAPLQNFLLQPPHSEYSHDSDLDWCQASERNRDRGIFAPNYGFSSREVDRRVCRDGALVGGFLRERTRDVRIRCIAFSGPRAVRRLRAEKR